MRAKERNEILGQAISKCTSISAVSSDEGNTVNTTEDEESDDEGNGNTGKPRPNKLFNVSTKLSESDDAVNSPTPDLMETARRIEVLFGGHLISTEV